MIRRKERKDGLVPREYWGHAWINPMSLMNDMDRLFDEFRTEWENEFLAPRGFAPDISRQPLVDLTDSGDEFVLKAEVPGLKRDDLTIEITENGVEISGETKSEEKTEDKGKGFIRRERRHARFFRSLPLPENILTDKADAELKDGVLTIKLPKAIPETRKSKKVEVR